MPDEAPSPASEAASSSFSDALRASGFMESVLGTEADTPAASSDQPTSDEGLAKPAATTEEQKPETQESSTEDTGEKSERTYTKDEVEARRATAQRERDTARRELEEARKQAADHQKLLEENEFQRGVQLLTIQYLEQLTLQKGATDLQDFRQAQMRAWQDMTAARSNAVEADIQKVQHEAHEEQWTQQQVDAANTKARAMFIEQAFEAREEAITKGVPTFDAKTALETVLFSEKYQRQVERIILLPANKQEEAAKDLYEQAREVVRGQMDKLAAAKAPRTAAPQSVAPTESSIPQPNARGGFDVATALENTFATENFNRIVSENPHLRAR